MRKLLLFISIAAFFASCNQTAPTADVNTIDSTAIELQAKASKLFGTLPDTAINPANPITAEKVALGKVLYFDKRLSKKETQSCNTCHNLSTFGVDNLATSPGDNGLPGTRNSPTTIHSGIQFVQFWDGRNIDVEEQAGGPVMNPAEMAMTDSTEVVKRLMKIAGYKALFEAAYPNEKNPITFTNIRKAIGAFERTLMPKSAFDDYLAGNLEAIDSTQQQGLMLFIDKGCTTCHLGAGIGGGMFQKFALYGNYWDYTKSTTIDSGRYVVTRNEADMFVWKTSMLRNITKTGPYFHDGSVQDIGEAVKIMGKTQLNQDLTDEETKKIVAFLETLTSPVSAEIAAEPVMPK